jgi:hypothetical protein
MTFEFLWSLSDRLSHDGPDLVRLLEDVPDSSLHGLGGLDYRKYLMADMTDGPGLHSGARVLGLPGLKRVIDEALFRSVKSRRFDDFNPEAFFRVRSSIPPISSLLLQVIT